MPAPARVARTMKQPRRGVVRAIVTFGVAAVVMTTAGAAAAGGGHFVNRATGPHAVRLEVSERSIGSLQRDVRAALPPPGRPSAPKEPHFTWRPRTPGLGEASRRSGCGMKPRRAGSGKAARVARSGKAARVVWRSGKTARVRSGKTARVRRSGDDGRGAAPPAAESRMRASGGRIFAPVLVIAVGFRRAARLNEPGAPLPPMRRCPGAAVPARRISRSGLPHYR